MFRLTLALILGAAALAAAEKIDNDIVLIHTATDLPHHKGAFHQHALNRVMIYLDGGDITIGYPDGRQERQHWKAGQVAWSPAGGQHTSENVSAAPLRIVEIELKQPAPPKPPVRNPALDPVALDPTHNILLFENPQVRVFRSWREPGGSEFMHEHTGRGRASILLSPIDATVKLADGSASQLHGVAGDFSWSGPVTHATTNNGPGRIEMIVVEVK